MAGAECLATGGVVRWLLAHGAWVVEAVGCVGSDAEVLMHCVADLARVELETGERFVEGPSLVAFFLAAHVEGHALDLQ
jgi:hypothetical protein